MASFGVPYPREKGVDATNACLCALDMTIRLKKFNAKRTSEGKDKLHIGLI